MRMAIAFEESEGAKVQDVHTPELARKAGLQDNPGFDLLSKRRNGEKRCIEVKGKARIGDVDVSANRVAGGLQSRKPILVLRCI